MTACQHEDYAAFGRRVFAGALQRRRPVAGTLALTYRCNLDCVHCYLGGSRATPEQPASFWCDLLDQLQAAGCLWLTLTGGEALLRPDFPEIYRHAKQRGFLVSVFSNGSLVDDAVIELFGEWPPHVVEISLYGFSARVHGAVTGVPGAREACFRGVERLAKAGVPLLLKTMALRPNVEELDRLRRFAAELGVRFRYDAMVVPRLDGSRAPWQAQMDAQRIVELERRDPSRRAGWRGYVAEHGLHPRRTLFACGGGLASFFVAPTGELGLCLYDRPAADLARTRFEDGWNGALARRRAQPLPEEHPCRGCRALPFCELCPPVARMITGDELGVPAALCALGRERYRATIEHETDPGAVLELGHAG